MLIHLKFFNIFYLDYWFPKSIILYPCVLRTFYRRAKSPTVHFNQEDTRPCERFTNNRLLKHHFLTNITFSSPWLFILHWESESPIVSRISPLICYTLVTLTGPTLGRQPSEWKFTLSRKTKILSIVGRIVGRHGVGLAVWQTHNFLLFQTLDVVPLSTCTCCKSLSQTLYGTSQETYKSKYRSGEPSQKLP